MIRDPRSDPQPGDELRDVHGFARRVIGCRGETVWCQSKGKRYSMRLATWREWCEQGDAKVLSVKEEG